MNPPDNSTPARPQLSDLFETCAANLKLDDVTLAPFMREPFAPVHIRPVVPPDDHLEDATRARFNQFIANAPAQFVGVTV